MLTVHPTASIQNSILQDYKSSYGINAKHEILAEFNINSYIDVKYYGIIDPLGNRIDNGEHYKYYSISGSSAAGIDIDYDRMDFTPLSSIFKSKTTDRNIYGGIFSKISTATMIPSASMVNIKKFNTDSPRFYPLSKNSSKQFWSSSRIIQNADKTSTIGVGRADSSGNITYSDIYIQYTESTYINKIKIKTQYYFAFPSRFRIYVTSDTGTSPTWEEVYSYTGSEPSSPLNQGDLEIYYNGTSWVIPDNSTKYTNDFSKSSSLVRSITGIRFKVEKMYSNISGMISDGSPDLQVLEISPRLICDISGYVKSFSINSQVARSDLGMPVGGIVNCSGNITISNVDKYFNLLQNNSILSKYIYPNVKFSISSIVNKTISGTPTDIRIPIKTVYANSWQQNDKTMDVSVDVEDYIKFFKITQSPDTLFSVKTGIRSSNAVMMLLDNIGYGKLKFIKTSDSATEDPFIKYFYSRKENTVAQTLEEIAISCQLSMFMDANNNFTVMTKERSCNSITSDSASWWFVGDPQNVSVSDNEYTYLKSSSYISNISDFTSQIEYPVTDINVSYSGLGIKRLENELIMVANTNRSDIISGSGTSFLAGGVYKPSSVWNGSSETNENILFAATLQNTISADVPTSMQNLSSNPPEIDALNEKDAIRRFYNNLSQNDKSKVQIKFSETDMIIISNTGTHSGYFNVDNETIRFNGILYNVYGANNNLISSSIIFSHEERLNLESNNIVKYTTPNSLILYMDFDQKESSSATILSNNFKKYVLKSHGRAAQTYKKSNIISEHIANTASSSSWSLINTVQLFNTTAFSNVNKAQVSNEQRGQIINSVRYVPRLFITGLTPSAGQTASITDYNQYNSIPVVFQQERFISGVGISSSVGYNIISTRLRLISNTIEGSTQYLSANGGIFFGLKNDGLGNCTGYFVELIDYGRVGTKRLADNQVDNLYLYKVTASADGQLYASILSQKLVTAFSVPETYTVSQINSSSKAATSDLKILILKNKICVYWEDQLALEYAMANAQKIIFDGITKTGLFVRGNSKVGFEYFLASSENGDRPLSEYGISLDITNSSYIPLNTLNLYGAAKNKYLNTQSLIQNINLNSSTKSTFYDDFGKICRQIKKISTRFDTAVYSPLFINFGLSNGSYIVNNFEANCFGADFWITNTSCDHLTLATGESLAPMSIVGYALEKLNDQDLTVTTEDLILENENEYNIDGSTQKSLPVYLNIQKNKEKYGNYSVSIESEYLSTYEEAKNLAHWISKNRSMARYALNIDIFPNPLLEIGDKVKLFYKDKGFCESICNEKSFIISAIDYSVSSSGPNMTVELRELF